VKLFFGSMTFFFVSMMYGWPSKPFLGVGEIAFVHVKVGSDGEERGPFRVEQCTELGIFAPHIACNFAQRSSQRLGMHYSIRIVTCPASRIK
jgi:hypothetical protein